MVPNLKTKSVNPHDFAMNPRADIPRSQFRMPKEHKTTMNFSDLVPILVEEVLPADTWKCQMTAVVRTAVPIVPIMDNWHLEFFSFFVPNRILWTNWPKFQGEQYLPGDSISFSIPQIVSAAGGFPVNSIYDYMGLPTVGQVGGANTISINALPLRAYAAIYCQWFRDENLVNTYSGNQVPQGDGPDPVAQYILAARGKRFDYFTQALPWPQKGNNAVVLPLGSQAPITTNATEFYTGGVKPTMMMRLATGAPLAGGLQIRSQGGAAQGFVESTTANATGAGGMYPTNLYADLSAATAATINQIRTAFQIQKLLERDARGGTRYQEILRAHFGVTPQDARLNRPEYIGGGRMEIMLNAIPQTSQTGLTGGSTPMGTLAATGSAQGRTGFTYNAVEHGYILTLACARADLTYSQGLRKMWSRSTRYDFYMPVFAALGEQALLNKEIYADGSANDNLAFGYVPRWDEYRHAPSMITGFFRSTSATPIDYWHSSQKFAALPTLNQTFILDDSKTVVQRNFAAGAQTASQQLLCDFYFDMNVARAMPTYGVPGMIDHF